MANLKAILFFFTTATSVFATNYFLPEWQQHCTKTHAEFHHQLHLHDILYSYATFHEKSLIIQDIANPILNLNIQPTKWSNLIEQLSRQYNFFIDTSQAIWSVEPKSSNILSTQAIYIKEEQLQNLKSHLKALCPTCLITKTEEKILISSPKIWQKTIKKTIQELNKPLKNIHLNTTIIQTNKDWLSSWGKKWQKTKTNSWLDALSLPKSQFSISKDMLASQVISHLLSSLRSNKTGKIIANAALTTTNKETTQIESGLIMPYYVKDSRNRSQIVFRPIALKVELTPVIQKNNLNLKINITYNSLDKTNNDIIHTQNISTRSNLKNHQTLVISSLSKNSHEELQDENILAFVPIIGPILQYAEHKDQNQLMLIFITVDF